MSSLFLWHVKPTASSFVPLRIIGQGSLRDVSQLRQDALLQAQSDLDLVFFERSAVRLEKGSEILVHSLDLDQRVSFDFELIQGRAWIFNLAYDHFDVRSGPIHVESDSSVLIVDKKDDAVTVSVYRHSAQVDLFLGTSSKRMLIPEGMEFSLDTFSLNENLAQLRYSKLRKEFLRKFHSTIFAEDFWFQANREKDDALVHAYQERMISYFRDLDIPLSSADSSLFALQDVSSKLNEVFTFSDVKRDAIRLEYLELPFLKAAVMLARGSVHDARIQIQLFKDFLAQKSDWLQDQSFLQKWNRLLTDHARQFVFVLPTENFYELKNLLHNIQMTPLEFSRSRLYDATDLLVLGKRSEAKAAFLAYKTSILDALSSANQDSLPVLLDEYYLIFHLLSREDDFLDAKYFRIFAGLENSILNLTHNDIDAFETRLAFISNKLRIVEKVFRLLKGNLLPVESSLNLVRMLLEESEALRITPGEYDVAVDEDFARRIREFRELLHFFESSEFESVGVYSDEFFEQWKKIQQGKEELRKYLQNLDKKPSGKIKRGPNQDILDAIKNDFASYGIKIVTFVPLDDGGDRLFSIEKATVGTFTFAANYDRETTILYGLIVNGSALPNDVLLSKFRAFLEGLASDQPAVLESPSTVVSTLLTEVERDFIKLVLRELAKNRIIVSESQLRILDFDEKTFFVNDVSFEGKSFLVSFAFDLDTQKASEIVVQTSLGPRNVSGELTLSVLEVKTEKVYTDAEAEYDTLFPS